VINLGSGNAVSLKGPADKIMALLGVNKRISLKKNVIDPKPVKSWNSSATVAGLKNCWDATSR
jgi:hypothetical protein